MSRPYVQVNCAMSADGKIASPTRKQMRISSEEDIARMYRLRNDCDAVLVGIETILSDNPKLTVKESYVPHPRQPLRVVLDRKGRTPIDALVLNDAANTLIFMEKGKEKSYGKPHVEVIGCPVDARGFIDLDCVLTTLHQRGVRRLLVEGGGTIIWSFLHHKVVDDLTVFIGSCIIGGTETPTMAEGEGIQDEQETILLKVVEVQKVGLGVLIHYHPLEKKP
jgi:2,5-diamino-6-(ribosylamino)-4(3H)-pyrimidinone 5'-phosphate reductase